MFARDAVTITADVWSVSDVWIQPTFPSKSRTFNPPPLRVRTRSGSSSYARRTIGVLVLGPSRTLAVPALTRTKGAAPAPTGVTRESRTTPTTTARVDTLRAIRFTPCLSTGRQQAAYQGTFSPQLSRAAADPFPASWCPRARHGVADSEGRRPPWTCALRPFRLAPRLHSRGHHDRAAAPADPCARDGGSMRVRWTRCRTRPRKNSETLTGGSRRPTCPTP